MKIETATQLIAPAIHTGVQTWADLGAGAGLFTTALSHRVSPGSRIYAIDQSKSAMEKIRVADGVYLELLVLDFVAAELPMYHLDGALMANALHFVRDKAKFLLRLKEHLSSVGKFVVVEYDTDRPNQWVPFPISFSTLQALLSDGQLGTATRIGGAKSIYHAEGMYSAIVEMKR